MNIQPQKSKIKFDFVDSKDSSATVSKWMKFNQDWQLLLSFDLALGLVEEMKKLPKLLCWRPAVLKSYYDDQGLHEGVYVDVRTTLNDSFSCDQDSRYEIEYNDKYQHRLEAVPEIRILNAFLTNKYFNDKINYKDLINKIFNDYELHEYHNNESGHRKLIEELVGADNYRHWQIEKEKKQINKNIKNNNKKIKNKTKI